MTHLKAFLEKLINIPELSTNIVYWKTETAKESVGYTFPSWIKSETVANYNKIGIPSLYSHQIEALELLNSGNNIVVSTGTASGKSLCYQVPIINRIESDLNSTALLLFPTKALTYDQYNSFLKYFHSKNYLNDQIVNIYDGDTPGHKRNQIRSLSRILLTNPDMLNIGILPHHTLWADYFSNLKYIVVDEVHLYKGVFGSHISNLFRRLKRILNFYGSNPQYILTSATIANPKDLAEKIIEQPFFLINNDGSPKGEKHFLIYNPPIINQELGIREGLISSIPKIASLLISNKVQTLIFCKTRKFVELLVIENRSIIGNFESKIRGYRSGYLPNDRREIEQGLKDGSVLLTVATNALELGVDIGGVDAVILAGYPGSIASLKQRVGRSGRSLNPSVSMLVTSMNPIDQYFAKNPEYLTQKSIEQALIDPDNPIILLDHIKSAIFELPYDDQSTFGKVEFSVVQEYLDYLIDEGLVQKKRNKYFWLADKYPSSQFSLRSSINNKILLQYKNDSEQEIIGDIDYSSALWMVHPGAVYIQDGFPFLVSELNLDMNLAELEDFNSDYLTEPILTADFQIVNQLDEKKLYYQNIGFGEVVVTSKVTGYKKIQSLTRIVLDTIPLEMPENKLSTTGMWVELSEKTINQMKDEGLWYSDSNDYGKNWKNIRKIVLARDKNTCQVCGRQESNTPFHVHHKVPFKSFSSIEIANDVNNLITLCPDCHQRAEVNIMVKSALSGLKYLLFNLAPLLVLCDSSDIDAYALPNAKFLNNLPTILLFDTIPAGIGLSKSIYDRFPLLLSKCREVIDTCTCHNGCPSCIGPSSDLAIGGKKETKFLINLLLSEI